MILINDEGLRVLVEEIGNYYIGELIETEPSITSRLKTHAVWVRFRGTSIQIPLAKGSESEMKDLLSLLDEKLRGGELPLHIAEAIEIRGRRL